VHALDIGIKTETAKFGVRAVAVIVHDGHVLLHQSDGEVIWNLPGGRVQILETAEAAVRRELLEELGEEVIVGPLQWVVERFHDDGARRYHEIGFYHLAQFCNPARNEKAETFHGREGDTLPITYRWFPISRIDEVPNLVPPFMYHALKRLPGDLKHVIDAT
jgi:8-oxo-dGTP pyrophosphatase MutT (NUDIX family)